MSESRLICHVDEAGCSGGKFGEGSSEFLAIGAIVYERASENDILSIFEEARKERGHQKKFSKFSSGRSSDNFVLTKQLAAKKARISQIAMHKPSLQGSFIRNNHKEEFQYLCKFILERVSWIARDSALAKGLPDTKCEVIFSQQKMYPYGDLMDYLRKLKTGRLKYNSRIDWQYLSDEISCTPHEDEKPPHLSDIVASAFHRAIEPKKHGITDDRFQRNLSPLVYRKDNKPWGIKLFPQRETQEMIKDGKFGFLKLL